MREKALAARASRDEYLTVEGKTNRKTKIQANMTLDRKNKFAKSTEKARKLAKKSQQDKADAFALKYYPIIQEMLEELTLTQIAQRLNREGYISRYGRYWTEQTVRQVLKRIHRLKQTEIRVRDLSSEVLRTDARSSVLKWRPK